MKKSIILLLFLFIGIDFLFAQSIKRDPEPRKDLANVFYNTQYTLFDYWSDEPIFPDNSGNYYIYYATNEDKTPREFSGSAYQLSNKAVYKFKNYSNCKNWCDGKVYKSIVASNSNVNTQIKSSSNVVITNTTKIETGKIFKDLQYIENLGAKSNSKTYFYNLDYIHQEFKFYDEPLAILDAKIDPGLGKNYFENEKEKLENLLKGYFELKKLDSILTIKFKKYENKIGNEDYYNTLKQSIQIIEFGSLWPEYSKKITKVLKYDAEQDYNGNFFKTSLNQGGDYNFSFHQLKSWRYLYIIYRDKNIKLYKILDKAITKHPEIIVQDKNKQSVIERETGLDEEYFKLKPELASVKEKLQFIEKYLFVSMPKKYDSQLNFSYVGNTKNGIPNGFGYLLNDKKQLITSAYFDEGFPIILYNLNLYHDPNGIFKDVYYFGETLSKKYANKFIILGSRKYQESKFITFNLYLGDFKISSSNVLFDGTGAYFYENWDKTNQQYYTGEWKNNSKNGLGKHVTKSEIYEGNWENGSLNYGSITSKIDNSVYTGQINEWKMNGEGRKVYANGKVEDGIFENGSYRMTKEQYVQELNRQEQVRLAEERRLEQIRLEEERKKNEYAESVVAGMYAYAQQIAKNPEKYFGSSDNSSSNTNQNQTSNSKGNCSSCKGTGLCSNCNKTVSKRYLDNCSHKERNELKPGYILCSQCSGYGYKLNFDASSCGCRNGVGTCPGESCYMECSNGWVDCRECNAGYHGNPGKCVDCNGTGNRR